jgi:transposase
VRTHLDDFEGYVQTDAYAAYDTMPQVNQGVGMVGCWAHVRRKFVDALAVEQEQADWFIKQIQRLYAIERFCRLMELTPQERLAMCRNAIPFLEGIKARMLKVAPTLTPKNVLNTAIRYTQNQWDEFLVYTTNGRLEIDNNLVENSIRPIALGRKNYLFAGDHEAAQRAAVIYSLMASCKACQINPLAYLSDVLDKLPARKVNHIDDPLPWNWKPDSNLQELDKM